MSKPQDSGPEERRAKLDSRITDLETQGLIDQATIARLTDEHTAELLARGHLEAALVACRRIGIAVGIVMAAAKLPEAQAFATLVAISQRQNRKLREVADDIVLTGDVMSN